LLSSPIIQRLREQETIVTNALASLSERLGSRHPEILSKQEELTNTRLQIMIESRKILESLKISLTGAKERVKRLDAGIAETRAAARKSTVEDVTLQDLLNQATAKRATFQSYLSRVQAATDAESNPLPNATIASPAFVPLHSNSMSIALIGPIGGFVGFILGSALVLLLETTRKPIYDGTELVDATGFAGLGEVPNGSGRRLKLPDLVIKDPHSAVTESVRGVWAGLRGIGKSRMSNVVIVTSTLPAEGKTSLVVALGRIAAMDGVRTVVVDCDFRKPAVGSMLGNHQAADDVVWVDEMLDESGAISVTLCRDESSGLSYLPAAGTLQNPHAALAGQKFTQLLSLLRREFDLILIDTPPVLNVSDTVTLVHHADILIYAAAWARTPRHLIKETVRRLKVSAGTQTFSVLTRVKQSKDAIGYYKGYGKHGRTTGMLLPHGGRDRIPPRMRLQRIQNHSARA
jgi:capsular exopolysaccharide synthesis family protein